MNRSQWNFIHSAYDYALAHGWMKPANPTEGNPCGEHLHHDGYCNICTIGELIQEEMMAPVFCQPCSESRPHIQHWYEGCTCAAGGVGENHSSHCDLFMVTCLRDDRLIKQ